MERQGGKWSLLIYYMKDHSRLTIDPNVDMANEQRVRKLTKERLPDKTPTSLLHRLEAAVEYDRILVMDGGKVTQFGSPAEAVRYSELRSSLGH